MEFWNAYAADGSLLPGKLERGKPLPEGMYHIACSTAIRRPDGCFLLMRRDWQKESYAGYWEIGAGGSAIFGETPLEAAKRELQEETGITGTDWRFLSSYCDGKDTIHYYYLCLYEGNPEEIVLQKGETIAHRWITPHQMRTFVEQKQGMDGQMQVFGPSILRFLEQQG